ncbi:hypothetical protein BS47DRAFT_1350515 [Hydnum rufescens UP504]|uniref:Uncharacterized protein n=1 Tax=Hydnum rufescens UP504 TaxID=1448309 RepID=A0A9P6AN44_9AGAM|nr:hypothetical protein BS47DRAFT_1350515 [Hydnum rufescens UP504]
MAAQNTPINPGPQLPDFAEITDHANHVVEGLPLLQNLPVVDNGAQILASLEYDNHLNSVNRQLNGLNARIGNVETNLNYRITALDARLDSLDTQFTNFGTRLQASETNAQARLFNSHISSRDTPLEPLVSAIDGTLIIGFPATSGALSGLSGTSSGSSMATC